MERRYEIAVVATIYSVGIGLFTTGLFLDSTPFYISSGCVTSLGTMALLSFCLKHKKPLPQPITSHTFQYRDPGMKRNKSDTDLSLIGGSPATNDNGVELV